MATYFNGNGNGNSEMQGSGDALQTLMFMNPSYVGYSGNQHQVQPPPPPSSTNFIFLNSSSSSQIHPLAGIPLQSAAAAAASPQHQDARFHYNLYNNNGSGAEPEVTRAKQGLSLSLSSQKPAAPSWPPGTEAPLPGAEEVRVFGIPEKSVLSCKYLKVVQELLDEVVNIRKEAKNGRESAKDDNNAQSKHTAEPSAPRARDGRGKRGEELTTAEKQEIQMKKAKLVDMLHEVTPLLIMLVLYILYQGL